MNANEKNTLLKTLEEVGYVVRPIEGKSMLPLLREAEDAVSLVPIEGDISVGDVVLYVRNNGRYVLHRVFQKAKGEYLIAGDNCIDFERVKRKDVLAVMNGYYHGDTFVPVSDEKYVAYTWDRIKILRRRRVFSFPLRILKKIKRAFTRKGKHAKEEL